MLFSKTLVLVYEKVIRVVGVSFKGWTSSAEAETHKFSSRAMWL